MMHDFFMQSYPFASSAAGCAATIIGGDSDKAGTQPWRNQAINISSRSTHLMWERNRLVLAVFARQLSLLHRVKSCVDASFELSIKIKFKPRYEKFSQNRSST